jgi:hypothetical protein
LIKTLCQQDDPKNRQRQTVYIQTAYSSEIIDLCASHPRSSEFQLVRKKPLDSPEWGIPEYRKKWWSLNTALALVSALFRLLIFDGLLDLARENAPRRSNIE